jgi:hypothetical protein
MNVLDRKIDSMIKDLPDYDRLKVSFEAFIKVSNRAAAIKFLKYAESLTKAAN